MLLSEKITTQSRHRPRMPRIRKFPYMNKKKMLYRISRFVGYQLTIETVLVLFYRLHKKKCTVF